MSAWNEKLSSTGGSGIPGLQGPSGANGSNGSNGSNGADGSDGLSAYEVAVSQGYTGTINEWILSLQGKSAYELAVQEGFVGSLNEWILSLQGTTTGAVVSIFGSDGIVTELDYVKLDITASPSPQIGQFRWNDTDGTTELLLKGGNVTLQIGQEQLIRVKNTTGSTLTSGTVVYISGAQSDRVLVGRASANSSLTSDRTVGVVTEDIAELAEGFVTTSGLVHDLNTSSWNEGDILYVSSTPGLFTNVYPETPLHAVAVAIVVRDHPTLGMVFVDIERGNSISDLHDVLISSISNEQTLIYDSVLGYWKNSKIKTINGNSLLGSGDLVIQAAVHMPFYTAAGTPNNIPLVT